MCAEITSYVAGRRAWSITYSGTDGVGAPEVAGELPAVAHAVLDSARKEQEAAGGAKADVDHLYDVVAELGHRLVGSRHDQTLGDGKHRPVLELAPQSR